MSQRGTVKPGKTGNRGNNGNTLTEANRAGSGAQEQRRENGPAPSASAGSSGQGASSMQSSQGSQAQFSNEEIAARAFEIFERDGRADGRDMDHWLQAERDLRAEREGQSSSGRSGTISTRADESPRSARRHEEQQAQGQAN